MHGSAFNSNILSKKQQFLSLLNLCASTKQLSQTHAQLQVLGLSQDPFLLRKLVYMYALSSFKNLDHATTLVYYSHDPPHVAWNMLIRGYASSHSPVKSIWVFNEMRCRGVKSTKLTFPFLFKSCAMAVALREGKQVQAEVVKCGLDSDVYVQNTLINFYACCKKILEAKQVFDEMSERTVVSWNSVIDACVENLWFKDGVGYFLKMRDCGFEPDETTMVVMLSACAELGNLSLGRWVHSQVIVRGMVLNCQLGTALVDMYAKSGAVGYAKFVFHRMEERNVWTWSAMILGLALHGFAEEALALFPKMNDYPSITPNYVTYLGVLCACSHVGLVNEGYQYFQDMEQVHGIKPMMMHYGAMVDILCRAGHLKEAYDFICGMPIVADAIVWRTLLSACTIHDVYDHKGIAHKVRKRLLQLEPRRGGNFVILANMYAEVGMWENAENTRRAMKDKGLKKMAGESCVELGGSMYSFYSGYNSLQELMMVYLLLDGLNLHLKMVNDL